MKILHAFGGSRNPYVDVLAGGLSRAGCPIEVGLDAFWSQRPFDFDIVHIQWPETIFSWRVPSADELDRLRQRLREVRGRATIVFTRHNDESHHARGGNRSILNQLYSLVESECDVMVHLGEASRAACRARADLAAKRHVVIPIPVYDELYAPFLDTDPPAARRRLNIPRGRKVVLVFGNFWTGEEKDLTRDAFLALGGGDACLVAPKWRPARARIFALLHPLAALREAGDARREAALGMKLEGRGFISHRDVARYFAASDVVFIPRLGGLNSGNIPMAFLFRKPVVGPDGGNIGTWIRSTGNLFYKAGDSSSARDALRAGLSASAAGLGESNFRFAMENWTTRRAAEMHASLYNEIHQARGS